MILRRLATALRKQDWFTVFIETMIVVLGVFLGLQVNNWNQNRVDRQDEAALLERLHDETVSAIEARAQRTRRVRTYMFDLYEMRKMLMGVEPFRPVTPEECKALLESNFFASPGGAIPVLDELVATGRFDLVSDQLVRKRASALLRARAEVQEGLMPLMLGSMDIAVEFPEAVRVGLAANDLPDDIDGYAPTATCDGEAMRADQKFLNGFSTNVANYNSYYDGGFVYLSSFYTELHEALDAALGLSHEKEHSESTS